MFVIPTHVGFTHRVVAMLVACAIVLWSVGVYSTAQAANLTQVSNTLTDSGPSVLSGHDIRFTIPTSSALVNTQDIVITFPSGFTGVSGLIAGDFTVTVNGTPDTPTNFTAVGQVVTFDGIDATANQVVRIVIAADQVVNPATTISHEFLITTQAGDSGRTRVAIVNYVEVTAEVQTSFIFAVTGLATSSTVNGTTTTGSSSANTLPFGVIAAGTVYTLGQELTVQTNARNGFNVTVEQDAAFLSSTGADIDSFSNGTNVNTPTAWSAPTNTLLDENTWGHWGLTSNDASNGVGGNEFTTGGGDRWVAASTTPRSIFSHTGPADGLTQDYGLARVAYRTQITPLQEAGFDYNTTLMYVATPTF